MLNRYIFYTRFKANNLKRKILVSDGYIYYDLFNQILGANMVRLISPIIPVTDEPQLCFSFWYAAFGAGESALLQIMRQDNSSGETAAEKVRVIRRFVSQLIL